MKIRIVATALGAMAAALMVASPAGAQTAANRLDHKDPYQTGCGNSAYEVTRARSTINSRMDGKVGTIKLMWSPKCKTNWIEINTITNGSGHITVRTADGREDVFRYRAGNNGRHWGNMLYANNMCAWGSATVQWNGGRGGQNGQGGTDPKKACR